MPNPSWSEMFRSGAMFQAARRKCPPKREHSPMRFLRDNGALLRACFASMACSGSCREKHEVPRHRLPATGFVAYITGENFFSALFANRKSEWLPMATHVVLAAYLFATRIVGVARPDDKSTDKEPPPRSRSWIYAFRSGYFLGAILHSTPMQPPMVRLCNPRCLSWQAHFCLEPSKTGNRSFFRRRRSSCSPCSAIHF